jgi:hypothetical protein
MRRLTRVEHVLRNARESARTAVEQSELRLYRQLEALVALYRLLDPKVPFPPMREWAGSPDFLLEIAGEILKRRPETVVECSSGVSTVVAARCCQLNGTGHVYSLENAPEFAEKTRNQLNAADLGAWATVVDAPLRPYTFEDKAYSWYSLTNLPERDVDFLIVDGPLGKLNEQARYPAGPVLIPRMTGRGIVVLDDSNRPDERKIIERWLLQFPQLEAESRNAEKGLTVLKRVGESHVPRPS